MLLNVLAFLILLLVVVCSLLLIVIIYATHVKMERDQEINSLNRLTIIRIENVADHAFKLVGKLNLLQDDLNDKMDALSSFVDERNTYVSFQQEQFKALAKSDMLAARRDQLLCLKEQKIVLDRIMNISTMSRQAPATIDVLAIESVDSRINELEKILKEDL